MRLTSRPARVAVVIAAALFALYAATFAGAQAPAPRTALKHGPGVEDILVISRGADGQTSCREATPEERHNLLRPEAARPGRVLIYPGASVALGARKDGGDAVTTESGQRLLASAGLRIVLHGTAQLNGNAAARDAFIVAANRWEAIISNQITVVLDVDFGTTFFGQPWPGPEVLGATGTVKRSHRLSLVRQQLLAAAPAPEEVALYNALPATSFPAEVFPNPYRADYLRLTRPLARALGLAPDITSPDSVPLMQGDAGIGFNSAQAFDFNPANGIDADKIDFDAVVTHEIGHALGFSSESGGGFAPSMLDLYRLRAGAVLPGNLAAFTNATRLMSTGVLHVFFSNRLNAFGTHELALSSGGPDGLEGDGRQSSHWKDENTVGGGAYIGIMDPSIADGFRGLITGNDKLAFDTFGYRLDGVMVAPPAPPPAQPPPNDDFAGAAALAEYPGTVWGETVNATGQAGEPDHANVSGPGRRSVWYTWMVPVTGTTTFNTRFSEFDTALAVYTGDAVGGLTLVAANDDEGGGLLSSRVTFEATGGTVYRIAVDGVGGSNGAFKLFWDVPVPKPGAAFVTFPSAAASVPEGDGTFGIVVTRTGDLFRPDEVQLNVTPGTATALFDYGVTPGPLTAVFARGQERVVVPFVINNDASPEPAETLTISFGNSATGLGLGPGAVTSLTLTIVDDDSFPANTVSISAEFAADLIVEENRDPHKIDLTVRRTGDLSQPASVDYSTDLGGRSGHDYTFAAGTLHFAAGDAAETITVLITEDSHDEFDESFGVTLNNAVGATIDHTQTSVLVTIRDDDPPALTTNANDLTANFVRQHYHDFLNREPDRDGIDFWSQGITSCGADAECIRVKRIDTSAAFFLAIEFQETGYLVYRMYKAAYGDIPGKPVPVRFHEFMRDSQEIARGVEVGVGDWFTHLENNKSAFAHAFVQRGRFKLALPESLTPAQFVDRLDANTGNLLTTQQRDALVNALANNNTPAGRAAALRQVAETQALRDAELRKAFVLMQYFGYLRRDPDAVGFDGESDPNFNGYNFWLGKLNDAGGDFRRAEMVRAFIESIEYRQRFGQ